MAHRSRADALDPAAQNPGIFARPGVRRPADRRKRPFSPSPLPSLLFLSSLAIGVAAAATNRQIASAHKSCDNGTRRATVADTECEAERHRDARVPPKPRCRLTTEECAAAAPGTRVSEGKQRPDGPCPNTPAQSTDTGVASLTIDGPGSSCVIFNSATDVRRLRQPGDRRSRIRGQPRGEEQHT
jgi:hypothetical protein